MSKENRVSDADWLDEAARYFEKRPTGGEDMAFWANVSNAERCRSIAQSLRSKPVAGVEVKPLEWKDCATNKGPGFDISGRHRLGVVFAETPIGTYVIASGPANLYEAWLCSGQVSGAYKTIDEAKAAAEADLRQRVLSTLSLPAQEPVAWRWRVVPGGWNYAGHLAIIPKGATIEPLYASPQPEAVITEEMVDRACKALFGSDRWPVGFGAAAAIDAQIGMRRALTAALKEA